MPLSSENRNLLRSYINQGLLPGVHSQDLRGMSAEEADFFIQCAKDNRWRSEKSLIEYYRQTELDVSLATPEQISQIIELGKAKYLNRISGQTLLKLTNLSARKLIWKGEMNRRRSLLCA